MEEQGLGGPAALQVEIVPSEVPQSLIVLLGDELINSSAQQQSSSFGHSLQAPTSLREINPSLLLEDFCRSVRSHPIVIMMNIEQINVIEKIVFFIVVIFELIIGEHRPLKSVEVKEAGAFTVLVGLNNPYTSTP
ncbi:MAG: hypothetical protein ABI763_17450 [Bacteroidota bacterium]